MNRPTGVFSVLDREIIGAALDELTNLRKSFTGRDVYERIHNKHVRGRTLDFAAFQGTQRQVSDYVRFLFNQQDKALVGYGSTVVPGGPIMYFPLPYHAKLHAERIRYLLTSGD